MVTRSADLPDHKNFARESKIQVSGQHYSDF